MQVGFPQQAYGRQDYGLAQTRLLNMFVELTPSGPTQDARLPRGGLSQAYSVGPGPIWGGYRAAGLFSGDRFTLSGNSVYREKTLLGSAPSTRCARWAASTTQLVLVTGGKAYCYDGTMFSQITDPDLPAVSDAFELGGRFYYNHQGTDQWSFSALGDATSIDGLAFASADEAPDANVAGVVLSDEAWFFGQETVEPWYPTGDATNPLARSQGRTYSRGCAAQQSIVRMDNALFFVDSDRRVCRTSSVPQRISTHGVEESLRACTSISDVTALHVPMDGHDFYVLNIPGQTSFAYDVSTQQWAEWGSYGQQTFRCRCAFQADGVTYLGDAVNGVVWKFDPAVVADGADTLERVASCTVLSSSGKQRCESVSLQTNPGRGLEDGTDPMVQMRYSDDGGRTWSDWDARSLGVVGDYTNRPVWKKLGSIQAPGRTFEFRQTDPVSCAFAGMTFNEKRA